MLHHVQCRQIKLVVKYDCSVMFLLFPDRFTKLCLFSNFKLCITAPFEKPCILIQLILLYILIFKNFFVLMLPVRANEMVSMMT